MAADLLDLLTGPLQDLANPVFILEQVLLHEEAHARNNLFLVIEVLAHD